MKRIVLDTNVVVSGLLWGGRPRELLALGRTRSIQLFTSQALLSELGITLLRSKFGPKLEGVGQTPDSLVAGYALLAEMVDCTPLPQRVAPDPDDDWVIATALAAKADLIVTGDKPLLGVRNVGEIRIVSVTEALALLAAD